MLFKIKYAHREYSTRYGSMGRPASIFCVMEQELNTNLFMLDKKIYPNDSPLLTGDCGPPRLVGEGDNTGDPPDPVRNGGAE